jgi:hypothetical protein
VRTPSSQPNANGEPDASPASRPQVRWGFVIRASALLIVILGTLTEHLPPRQAILFVVAVIAGGLLWKIPPFEVGPSPGLHNGFLPATWDRGRSAATKIAVWGGAGAVFGTLFGALAVLFEQEVDLAYMAGVGAVWGTVVCATLGILIWIAARVRLDAEVLWYRRKADSSDL